MPPVNEIREKAKSLLSYSSETEGKPGALWRGRQRGTRFMLAKWGVPDSYSLIAQFSGRSRRGLEKIETEFKQALGTPEYTVGDSTQEQSRFRRRESSIVWTAKFLAQQPIK